MCEKMNDCILKTFCDNECSRDCRDYLKLNRMLNEGNIPLIYRKVNKLIPEPIDYEAFDTLAYIRDNIKYFVSNGYQAYIWSVNCGNGKTTWSIKLLLQYIYEMKDYSAFNTRSLFINFPWFIYKYKDTINNPDKEFDNLKTKLFNADLVVWDELGAKELTTYELDILYGILNERLCSGKANIYTGNISLNQLLDSVEFRLLDRLSNNCFEVEFKGGSHRGSITDFK